MKAVRRLLRSGAPLSLASSGAVQAITIATGVLLARSLGPSGRGELAAALLWPAVLAAVGGLGVADSVTFNVARRHLPAGTAAGTALAIGAVQSVVLVAIGLAIVPFVHAAGRASYVALAFVPAYLLTLYLMNVLNGLRRYRAYQLLRVLVLVNIAVFLGLLALARSVVVEHAVVVHVTAHALVGIVALVLVVRAKDTPLRADRRAARTLLSFGVRTQLHGIATILNERLDQLVISLLLGAASLGLYVVAVTLTAATALVGSSLAIVALPELASLSNEAERVSAARRVLALTFGVSAAVSAVLALAAPELIHLFFGPSFAPSVPVARVLLAAAVLLSTSRALAAVLTALGRPLDAGVPEIVGLAVTVVALAVLLPWLGLLGAGLASLAAYAATLAWMLVRAGRVIEVRPETLLLPATGSAR